ncbi:hypothetical protein [Anaerocolumna jejuensis]|uniref:hypothetical protein n=1 Tax=Anaerocolumna jejuensis TaxID=259063 RepID=UPI003F7B9E6B
MKRLKHLFMALIMVTCMLGSSVPVSASSYSTGKAVIPQFKGSDREFSAYQISNITDSPIDVTITLYDKDGTIVTDDNSPITGFIIANNASISNYSDKNNDYTLSFTLNAHCSTSFQAAYSDIPHYGYGVISWKQSGTTLQGLVAFGVLYNGFNNHDYTYVHDISINNGLPF